MKNCLHFYKAQHTVELVLLSSLAVSICVGVLMLFGDDIGEILQHNREVAGKDASARTSFLADSTSSSATTITFRDLKLEVGSSYTSDSVQTSGSDGLVLEEMITAAMNLLTVLDSLNNISSGTYDSINTQLLTMMNKISACLSADGVSSLASNEQLLEYMYNNKDSFDLLSGYSSYDEFVAAMTNGSIVTTGSADQVLKTLEASVDLNKEGDTATSLQDAIDTLLDSLSEGSTEAQLISSLTESIIALGGSLELDIDSRIYDKIETYLEYLTQLQEATGGANAENIISEITIPDDLTEAENAALKNELDELEDIIQTGDSEAAQVKYSQLVVEYGIDPLEAEGTLKQVYDYRAALWNDSTMTTTKTLTLDGVTITRKVVENTDKGAQKHTMTFTVGDNKLSPLSDTQVEALGLDDNLISYYKEQGYADVFVYYDSTTSAIYIVPYCEVLSNGKGLEQMSDTYIISDELVTISVSDSDLSVADCSQYKIYSNDQSVSLVSESMTSIDSRYNRSGDKTSSNDSKNSALTESLTGISVPNFDTVEEALIYMIENPDSIPEEYQLSQEEISQIYVYSEGNLSEILENASGTSSICTNVFGGTVVNNEDGSLTCQYSN